MKSTTISLLRQALASGTVAAQSLAEHYLGRIEAGNGELNCFITPTPEQARADAWAADQCIERGQAGPLTGVPIAVKDLFCTQGIRTTCGSRMLDNFIAPYDATVVTRLREAGMVLLGKTNMDEFAMGSSNETSYYGPVRNPWDTSKVPGGSSGGSAVAVASGMAPVALGTDTGGSVRQPAALCGISGLKPTYGRVSRYGMVAYASSLDQAGIFGRSAADIAPVLTAITGFDPKDSTSVDHPVEDYAEALSQPVKGLKVGVPEQYFGEGLDADVETVVRAAIENLVGMGAEIHPVNLPNSRFAIPAYYIIAPAECSSNLSRFDGVRYGYRSPNADSLNALYERSRAEGFGAEVKRRVLVGTYALSAGYYDAYYLKAQQIRRLVNDDFQRAFEGVDVVVGPTSPTVAFGLGERTQDPVSMYLSDIYTISVNLAGLCGISIPAGFAHGLPVGLQLIGDHFQESKLLRIAHQFQQATDWHHQRPPRYPQADLPTGTTKGTTSGTTRLDESQVGNPPHPIRGATR